MYGKKAKKIGDDPWTLADAAALRSTVIGTQWPQVRRWQAALWGIFVEPRELLDAARLPR